VALCLLSHVPGGKSLCISELLCNEIKINDLSISTGI